jgi:hypothetical protein
MAASLKEKRMPITTPPYQVPSVDITPDPPIFLLVTTFNFTNEKNKLILIFLLNFKHFKRWYNVVNLFGCRVNYYRSVPSY